MQLAANQLAAWAPVVIAGVGFVGFCLVDLARHPVRLLPKPVWAAVVVLSVPLGGVAYLLFGRDRTGSHA